MDYTTLRRLRIADALAWPAAIGAYAFHDTQPERFGGVHTLLLLALCIWAARKLGHALEGYRAPTGGARLFFNPFNPLGWVVLGVMRLTARRDGEYAFFTLWVVKAAGALGAVWLLMLISTGAWRNGLAVLLN